ncbi:hypothetical protein J4Q44_G00003250 [Coregonus suidteri]|uniref:Uncharacterized protein n=1 Tax=Coregonus suidteri TaxID=861788 RepID=A0AAN8MJ52_9TELE
MLSETTAESHLMEKELEEWLGLGLDGGWDWMVLLICFVVTGFSYAFPKAISVYFKELMRDFDVGHSDTA